MIGSILQRLLDEKGTNVNELSHTIGVSPQTLYSIIKRDNMKIDFEILLKICHELNVGVDIFYREFASQYKSSPDSQSFGPSEYHIIQKYRTLDAHGKKLVDMVLDTEYNRVTATTPPAASPKKDNIVLVAARGGHGVETYTISDEAAREADEAIARLEAEGENHEADDL